MAELTQDIKRIRLKNATEAYAELKAIHASTSLDSLLPREPGDEPDEVDSAIPAWPVFLDGFIKDWTSIREIKTDKEADAMFDHDVETALAVIEATEQNVTDSLPVVDTTPVAAPVVETAPVVAVKRKPRAVKAAVKAVKKAPRKVAAKKKSVGSASAKAQVIIEKYAGNDAWPRKRVIGKLQAQLGMGAAYASKLYQKFA